MRRERINQIDQRLAQIEAELRTAPDTTSIDALSSEANKLIEERARLVAEEAAEARAAFAQATGTQVVVPQTNPDAEVEQRIANLSKRDKLAFMIGRQARKRSFTNVERRALGNALTTTATDFVAPTASTDGVNNAGIFISTKLVLDFLKEDGKLSPLFADVAFTHIKGLIDFPYRESRTKAEAKAEGQGTKSGSWKWGKLTGTRGTLQSVMEVTDEVLALSEIELGEYIANQMLQDLPEDWSEDIIYGTATNNHIKGVTYGLTAKDFTDSMSGLVEGIKACTGHFRRGAKIYCAQDVYDDIFFAVDKNGNFKYQVLNNPNGVTSIGSIHIAVDENLKAGEFIIGNISRYFKANLLRGLSLETERDAVEGITTYVVKEMCSTAIHPNAFVYGKKKTTE